MSQINWAAASDTFPRFVKLLDLPGYRRHVLLGITVSVGGLTESLVSSIFLTFCVVVFIVNYQK